MRTLGVMLAANRLEGMLARLRAARLARWLVVGLRVVMGLAFVPPALPKILGERFTRLGPDTPVGYFFEAFYQAGPYWHFIGWCQLAAGVLLVTQRWATVGALLYLPIITNIMVITYALDFRGTPVVTTLMFVAIVLLLAWDVEKLKPLFRR